MKRTLFSVALVGLGVAALGGFENGDGVPQPPAKEWAARNDALTRARVFRDEPFDAASIDFAVDPNRGVVDPDAHELQVQADEVSGTTPKFDCELPSGEKIKVKYGWTQEIPSEVAATRLLHALGFGADQRVTRRDGAVLWVPVPAIPHARAARDAQRSTAYVDKQHRLLLVSRLQGRQRRAQSRRRADRSRATSAGGHSTSSNKIDPSRGGATRAEVDALRLMAVFLHHWDNKILESAADVRECEDSGLRASARDDSGRRFRVRSEESRPRQLAIEAGLARCRSAASCR